MMADRRLVIRGGVVVDGTGAPAKREDVLIEDGRIATVEPSVDGLSAGDVAEVNAAGMIVAPGFIDVHVHADFTLLAFPEAESANRQGVTTVVNGNCGGGVAPAFPEHDVRRVAFGYHDGWGVDISWQSFAEYLEQLHGLGVNAATLVPHGALRNAVMGLDARPASRSERARMADLLDEALDAGAVGLSSGLEYQPGCNADVTELSELAGVVARYDGVYSTHIRNRADQFVAATNEAIEVALRGPVRLQLSHFAPRPYAPAEQTEAALSAVDQLVETGHPVWVDSFPEIWGPGPLLDLFPADVVRGEPREVLHRLRDPHVRAHVAGWFGSGENFLVRAGGYDRIFVSSNPARPEQNGRSLSDLATAAGQDIPSFCCETMLAAAELFPSIAIRTVYATEGDLRRLLKMPNCSLGSDGVVTSGEGTECPYPWNASSYGYAARVLGHYVRDVGLYELEDAVRRLAFLPAQAVGLRDRGTIGPGMTADIVVFDPSRICDRTTPADMARHPDGIEHVLLSGVPVVTAGRPTRAQPGGAVGSRTS